MDRTLFDAEHDMLRPTSRQLGVVSTRGQLLGGHEHRDARVQRIDAGTCEIMRGIVAEPLGL